MNFSDPFGLCPFCPALVGGLFGLAAEGVSQAAGRNFDAIALVKSAAVGAASGQFAALKVARGVAYAGQAAIGAVGGFLGSADEGFRGEGAAFGALFGGFGQLGGELLEKAAVSGAGRRAMGEFWAYTDDFLSHQRATGLYSEADLSGFRNALQELLENQRAQAGGLAAGLVGGTVRDSRDD